MAVLDATVACQGDDCQTNLVKTDEFVAESPVCSGDSGGPALDSEGRVCGVTSRGDDQCTIAIYSSVAAWRDFIVEKTFEAAKGGGYTPPTWAGDPPPGFETGGAGGGGTGGSAHSGTGGGTPSGGSGASTAGTDAGGANSAGSHAGGTSAGSSDRGGSSSNGGGAKGGTGPGEMPTFEQTGKECSEQSPCLGSYKCWTASGTPPGICVPACGAAATSCPSGYSCDTMLNACIKPAAAQGETGDDGGCSVGAGPARHRGVWLGVSLILLQLARRRGERRRPRSQPG